MNAIRMLMTVSAAAAVLATACGGSKTAAPTSTASSAAPTTTPAATQGAVRSATAPATSAVKTTVASPAAASTGLPGASSDGKTYNETQATTLLADASLTPKDLDAGWTIMTDVSQDNAAAAAADPTVAAANERCGRLAGRVVTNQPPDIVSAYVTGIAVSYFSQLTVYATAAGATDCAAEAANRFAMPGVFARAFGAIFKDPDAVKIQPVDYPPTADSSGAFALTGDIDAAGTTVQLQIVLVSFRKGNVTGVVGTATSPLTNPAVGDLPKYVNLVLQRIGAEQ